MHTQREKHFHVVGDRVDAHRREKEYQHVLYTFTRFPHFYLSYSKTGSSGEERKPLVKFQIRQKVQRNNVSLLEVKEKRSNSHIIFASAQTKRKEIFL